MPAGQIGALAEEYVEGTLNIEGRMRDVMTVAASLLQSDPVRGTSHWWVHAMARMRSMAAHTLARDAQQIQFHYDVSDDFYALWLAASWLGEHRNPISHLYQLIREKRGLNYGDYAYIEAFPRGMYQFFPDPNIARQQQLFEVWIRPVRGLICSGRRSV